MKTPKRKALILLSAAMVLILLAFLFIDLSESPKKWREMFGSESPSYLFKGSILWGIIGFAVVVIHKSIVEVILWLAPRKDFFGVFWYRLFGGAGLILTGILILISSLFWSGMGGDQSVISLIHGMFWLSGKFTVGLGFIIIPCLCLIAIGSTQKAK